MGPKTILLQRQGWNGIWGSLLLTIVPKAKKRFERREVVRVSCRLATTSSPPTARADG